MSPRALALPLALFLGLSLSLPGGGAAAGGGHRAAPLDQVTISGEPGTAPEVSWKGTFEASSVTTKVISKGDGQEVQDGDSVDAHIWIGNGYTHEKAYSTYDTKAPQTLQVSKDELSEVFLDGLVGQTIGSRVAVAAPASDAFGADGNPQLGIGNRDSILVVLDLMGLHVPPKPKDVSPSKLPRLETKEGDPTGFDFSKVDKPAKDGDLLRSVLKEGDGPTVTQDMTVTADYLGEVYGATKPFDESYSKKPVPFSLSGVVEGWKYGLSGLKVGSRVLLQIPPDLGYGAQPQAGIPANSTLYFVVDIIKAK